MKKILMCTAAATMLAGSAFAESGAYVGVGFGKAFASADTKIDARGLDNSFDPIYSSLGKRKLKDNRAITGKLFGGYEFAFSGFSVLTEAGIALDNSEAKYDRNITVTVAVDQSDPTPVPSVITSTSLKRKYTFSIGAGIKKEFANKISALVGIDVLYSGFEIKSKTQGNYDPAPTGVSKKRSKFGIAPWVGATWDLGLVETGLRYQYAKYQTVKNSGSFSEEGGVVNLGVSNKAKPEYHTVMLTVSKKF